MESGSIEDLDPSSNQTEEVRGGISAINGNLQIAQVTSVSIDPGASRIGVGELQETTVTKQMDI